MKRWLQIEYQKVGSKTDAHRGGGRLVHHSNSLKFIPIVITIMGFPGGLAGKESAWSVGDPASIPGLERSPGERNGYLLQYSGLENSMDRSLVGYSSWGHKELDMDRATNTFTFTNTTPHPMIVLNHHIHQHRVTFGSTNILCNIR